jgi:hypothetical protein
MREAVPSRYGSARRTLKENFKRVSKVYRNCSNQPRPDGLLSDGVVVAVMQVVENSPTGEKSLRAS